MRFPSPGPSPASSPFAACAGGICDLSDVNLPGCRYQPGTGTSRSKAVPVFPPGEDFAPSQLAGTRAPVQRAQATVCDQDRRPHEVGFVKVTLVLINAGEQDERIQVIPGVQVRLGVGACGGRRSDPVGPRALAYPGSPAHSGRPRDTPCDLAVHGGASLRPTGPSSLTGGPKGPGAQGLPLRCRSHRWRTNGTYGTYGTYGNGWRWFISSRLSDADATPVMRKITRM